MNLEALLKQLAFLFFSWFILVRQCLFLTFDKVGFTFSAISWQFPILTSKKSAFSPFHLIAFSVSPTYLIKCTDFTWF